MPHRHRLPVSTRHAFALAFDLAFRRDPLHSLVVPLLLRAPWSIAIGLISPLILAGGVTGWVVLVGSLLLLGEFLTWLVVNAMLRLRARSVFNTAPHVAPMPAGAGYRAGFRRVPWLIVTELVRTFCLGLAATIAVLPATLVRVTMESFLQDLGRNVILVVVTVCLALPVVMLGCRLGVATEAVVLDDHDLGGAFTHSFALMAGRFERWFELIVGSGLVVLAVALLCAVLTFVSPLLAGPAGLSALWLLLVFITPVIQYAWTFFYLRLTEVEHLAADAGAPVPDAGAGVRAASQPALRLVTPESPREQGRPGA